MYRLTNTDMHPAKRLSAIILATILVWESVSVALAATNSHGQAVAVQKMKASDKNVAILRMAQTELERRIKAAAIAAEDKRALLAKLPAIGIRIDEYEKLPNKARLKKAVAAFKEVVVALYEDGPQQERRTPAPKTPEAPRLPSDSREPQPAPSPAPPNNSEQGAPKTPAPSGTIFRTGFENDAWYGLLYRGNVGSIGKKFTSYSQDSWRETNPANVKAWSSSLWWQNRWGTNVVWWYQFNSFSEDGPLYVKYSRKYEKDFEFKTEAKGHGIFAYANYQPIGAWNRPNGFDAYSCRVQIMQDGWYDNETRKSRVWNDSRKWEPVLYCYHLDQITGYGDKFKQDPDNAIFIEAGKWYEYEMMLKPNAPGMKDGEAKLWIDGTLRIHKTGLEFRKTHQLKMNVFELSAWAGWWSPAPKDQRLYDDSVSLSTARSADSAWQNHEDVGRDSYYPKTGSEPAPGNTPPNRDSDQSKPLPPDSGKPDRDSGNQEPANPPAPPQWSGTNVCQDPDIMAWGLSWQACNLWATRAYSWDPYVPVKDYRPWDPLSESRYGKIVALWNGANPCPTGYRLPTKDEWSRAANSAAPTDSPWWMESRLWKLAEILKLPMLPYLENGTLNGWKLGLYHSWTEKDASHRFVFEYANAYWAWLDQAFSSYPNGWGLPVRCVRN